MEMGSFPNQRFTNEEKLVNLKLARIGLITPPVISLLTPPKDGFGVQDTLPATADVLMIGGFWNFLEMCHYEYFVGGV